MITLQGIESHWEQETAVGNRRLLAGKEDGYGTENLYREPQNTNKSLIWPLHVEGDCKTLKFSSEVEDI